MIIDPPVTALETRCPDCAARVDGAPLYDMRCNFCVADHLSLMPDYARARAALIGLIKDADRRAAIGELVLDKRPGWRE